MRKTSVYLTPEEIQALRLAAARTGCSQAELIREGVRLVTTTSGSKRRVFRSLAKGHGGGVQYGAPSIDRGQPGVLARQLVDMPVEEWNGFLLELVSGEIRAVLGWGSEDEVPPERTFRAMGFDSLVALELVRRLEQATGLRIPVTLVFDNPTPLAVGQFLRAQLERRGRGWDPDELYRSVTGRSR